MRVLIAEDELLERKAMCKFLESNFPDLQIAGEAANGREAIEAARRTPLDMILMDIKMPGIDGLEAVKTIMEDGPHVKFILISAFDSFAYAKQAMQFGIKEYILKPGKKPEMIQAIRRVQKEIEAERKDAEEKRVSDRMVKEHLLTKLMTFPVDEAAARMHQQYFPQMNDGYFIVAQTHSAITEEEVYCGLENLIPSPFIFKSQEDMQTACVFSNGRKTKKDILQLAQNLSLRWGRDSVIGVSRSTDFNNLPKAYQEAFTACYELGIRHGRSYGFLEKQTSEPSISITTLIDLIERGKADAAVDWFNDHNQEVKREGMDELYMRVKAIMAERNLSMPGQHFLGLTTDKDRKHWISICSLKIDEYRQSQQYVKRAKQFIRQHYPDAISLEETAAHVHLSPNYFSNLFKQECGISFIDYLNQMRLQKAKELLEGHDYSLKEISAIVGYNNPNYFSRVFKKYFNESPTAFQQAIVKK